MVRASRNTRRRMPAPTATGNNNGSVVLMQPKLESQSFLLDQQQHHQPPLPPALPSLLSQTKMIPIAPRYDSNPTASSAYTCSNCTLPIQERYFLHTQDRLSRGNYWHMQCLRCQCCDVVLAEIAPTFYMKDNALLCKSDYIKKYGCRPCSLCSQVIGPNEQIMRVSPNYVYHLPCFTCMKCQIPLVKGDRYVLCNGQLFCEKDNPLPSATNINPTPVPKRGTTTAKRGAKAAARTAAATAAQVQQTFITPSSYHHTGHISLLNNPHTSSTLTHSLLSNTNNLTSNGSLSIAAAAAASGDELY